VLGLGLGLVGIVDLRNSGPKSVNSWAHRLAVC